MKNGDRPAAPAEAFLEGTVFRTGVYPGLTKREEFAKVAMGGLCSHSGTNGINNSPDTISRRAFEIADAMLAEQEKQQ